MDEFEKRWESMVAALKTLTAYCHEASKRKGWWDDPVTHETIPSKLMLVTSELAEALEEYRNGRMMRWFSGEDHKPEGFDVELADAIIRICDLAGKLEIDLGLAIVEKLAFNQRRAHRHGGKAV